MECSVNNDYQSNKTYNFSALITVLLTLILSYGCAGSMQNERFTRNSGDQGASTFHPEAQKADEGKRSDELIRGGYVYLASDNPMLAKMLFLRAIEQTPDSPEAFIGLGEIEYQSGNYENAYTNFNQAALLDAQNVRALVGKARTQRQQNKFKAAIQEINVAMATAPNEIEVLTELAIIYDLMGKEVLSEPIYQEILARVPDQAASNNNLGLNYLIQRDYEKAILAFEKAVDLDSNDSRIKNNLGTAFALYGNEQMALRIFKTTVGEAGAYNNLGYLYMTQGRLEDAERALEIALDTSPTYYQKAQENLDVVKRLLKTER